MDGGSQTVLCDALLFATGRVPNRDILGLAQSGVEADPRGFIKTNQYLETTAKGIWSLGDIVGKYLLKHSANLEAAYAVHNIFNPDSQVEVNYPTMPCLTPYSSHPR